MRALIEIKRIELWSLFKIAFVLYAALGLLLGIVYGFFILVAGGLQTALLGEDFPQFGILGGLLGIVLIPVFAVFYGAIGSVFVTIGGFIFNVVVGMAGGLRVETDVVSMGQPAEASMPAAPATPGPPAPPA
ncbi:MAG: hypothetical protein ACE5EO_03935 [Candidatus Krumholzibacteriia bacterium]